MALWSSINFSRNIMHNTLKIAQIGECRIGLIDDEFVVCHKINLHAKYLAKMQTLTYTSMWCSGQQSKMVNESYNKLVPHNEFTWNNRSECI